MSKKPPLNNLIQFELSQKNSKIEILSKEKNKYIKLMHNMQSELFNLKNRLQNNNKLEKELKLYHDRNIELENEVNKLTKQILEIHKKYNEEKRKNENIYNEEIKMLKSENEKYKTKIEMVNELAREKNGLLKAFDKVLQERNNILIEHDKKMREKEVNNQIKVSNLKKKMIDSVNETQSKVKELNLQSMDTTNKLTLLQNNQLILKIEYLNQHINTLTTKNEQLENKVYELTKDIKIHKEVELSLAEKNKRLADKNNKLKMKNENENEKLDNIHLIPCNSSINLGFNSLEKANIQFNKIIQLEQKVLNLERKIQIKHREYNELKDKNDSIEKILKNYEEKYSGLFNYFEECLKMFINDDELYNNKDIFVNLESMKKGDFTKLNNEEKYSVLIILMKYLMPLIHKTEEINNINSLKNVNLKFHFINNDKNKIINSNNDNEKGNNFLKIIKTKKCFNKNNLNLYTPTSIKYNSFESFPDLERKIHLLKMPLLSPKKKNINIRIKELE